MINRIFKTMFHFSILFMKKIWEMYSKCRIIRKCFFWGWVEGRLAVGQTFYKSIISISTWSTYCFIKLLFSYNSYIVLSQNQCLIHIVWKYLEMNEVINKIKPYIQTNLLLLFSLFTTVPNKSINKWSLLLQHSNINLLLCQI